MKKALRITAALVCLGLAVFFLLPLTIGTVHIGMLYPAALLLLAALGLLFPAAVGRLFTGKLRPFAIAFSAVLGTAVVCILAVCLLIGAAANNGPSEEEDVTVVVLGCQVKGSRSGIMLRQRIETA